MTGDVLEEVRHRIVAYYQPEKYLLPQPAQVSSLHHLPHLPAHDALLMLVGKAS
jgi:hypothetical protein